MMFSDLFDKKNPDQTETVTVTYFLLHQGITLMLLFIEIKFL